MQPSKQGMEGATAALCRRSWADPWKHRTYSDTPSPCLVGTLLLQCQHWCWRGCWCCCARSPRCATLSYMPCAHLPVHRALAPCSLFDTDADVGLRVGLQQSGARTDNMWKASLVRPRADAHTTCCPGPTRLQTGTAAAFLAWRWGCCTAFLSTGRRCTAPHPVVLEFGLHRLPAGLPPFLVRLGWGPAGGLQPRRLPGLGHQGAGAGLQRRPCRGDARRGRPRGQRRRWQGRRRRRVAGPASPQAGADLHARNGGGRLPGAGEPPSTPNP